MSSMIGKQLIHLTNQPWGKSDRVESAVSKGISGSTSSIRWEQLGLALIIQPIASAIAPLHSLNMFIARSRDRKNACC